MSTYWLYKEACALCGDYIPARNMNKLYVGESHNSCPTPRKLCCVCDNCIPKLLDHLEVSLPEKTERPYTPPRWCRKCLRTVGKTAKFCPGCGAELATQIMKEEAPNE